MAAVRSVRPARRRRATSLGLMMFYVNWWVRGGNTQKAYPRRNQCSIVPRLLNTLGWLVYDIEGVASEYSLGGRRVDYALCYPLREPLVMVEVKQIGQSKGADHQLFEYTFHKGVPMAVLPDRQEWHFFPTEQGDYGERRVCKLDLLERDPQVAEAGPSLTGTRASPTTLRVSP